MPAPTLVKLPAPVKLPWIDSLPSSDPAVKVLLLAISIVPLPVIDWMVSVVFISYVVPEFTMTSVLSDKVPLNVSVPPLIVVSPVKVLFPDKVTVPEPAFTKFPLPEITPEYVAVFEWLKFVLPLLNVILFWTVVPLLVVILVPPPNIILPPPDTWFFPASNVNPPVPDLVILLLI